VEVVNFHAVPEPGTTVLLGIGALGALAFAWRRRLRRRDAFSAIVLAGVAAIASDARAVILYSDPGRNTTPPSAAQGLDGWNYEFQWGNFLATPIDGNHFIAARHVGLQATSISFTYQGNTQTLLVDQSSPVNDPVSDLAIFKLQAGYSFPIYAPLYSAAVDGSELGKTLTVMGRGTQRGSEMRVNSVMAPTPRRTRAEGSGVA
jgi:hypothetical protein